ncbi:hypothetical protein [Amnibacterium endophyticum]|uniref:Sugar ABC transporter permease n=1 Tax=Amnibacterium endophyticum TaxID=2109337 RepID=A0ABW4LLS4_9MICO
MRAATTKPKGGNTDSGALMVPLVFLILPVTVAFAVWPAVLALQTQL